ncbi:S8 family serine peptidase [Nakamurella deserti]|uniref:S8 family serine peptidase n=1 Tax=Nakamurella deserti TaxID=2164074 RepID=UPI000DBE947D
MTGAGPAAADPDADPGTTDPPKDSASETLSSHDLDLLADAEAKGEQQVTLIVATEKGETAPVADEMVALGGQVANQVDDLGYVRVQVPTAEVLKASTVTGVLAMDLNEVLMRPKPEPQRSDAAAGAVAAQAGPGADTPADNPFMPTAETGAVGFVRAHPEWDGRGVTIGIMDSGVDLDNPALQTTSTGERKIVDWFTATDPVFDNDLTWRPMLTAVSGPTFTFGGQQWTAPAGAYLVNRFSESITAGSSPGGDVNRDGDTTDRFGVLYDPATGDVRVDVDQDLDFTDEAVMRPYAEKFDVGHFGTDDPATDVREQMPFTVEVRKAVSLAPYNLPGTADFVNIGIIEDEHGSHVAGITAANDMLGNPNLDGAAPGATIVSARACSWGGGCTAAALTDGMVELVRNRKVDVVNMSIGGLPALNDGNNARSLLYTRLIDDYGVQLFISAGNSGPGVNTIGDPSVASDVVSVAAGISRKTWLANYGSVVRTSYGMFNFSSRGPREDGGFKPNLTAPGSAISTTPLWQPGGPVPQAGYPLPPGYQMLNGTSMASPQAAGGAALLLSAARATDRGITPAQLRRALYSSATFIKGVQAAAQGNGRMNVNKAWRLLARDVEVPEYTSSAPVCTPLSGSLATPDRGQGIYNRCAAGAGGLAAGTAQTYTVTVTRTVGKPGSTRHTLRWVGNDGTFSSARTVELPLGQPVDIPVRVEGDAGIHSASLEVDDWRTPTVDFEIMNAVLVSTAPTEPAFSVVNRGTVDRNATRSFLVTVPEGAPALQVDLSGIATGSQTRFIAINPYGVPVESTSSLECFTNFSDPATCNPQERSFSEPMAGVWEFEVESRRTSPSINNPFRLTARIQGVDVQPEVVEVAQATVGVATPVTWNLTNTFGAVTVHGEGGPMGSSAASRPTIADGQTLSYEVEVPAGTTRLDVGIGGTTDQSADLDLTLSLNGVQVAQQADGDSEEAVTLVNPAAGTYTAEVVGYDVPAGTTEFDYTDVFYSPTLGAVSAPATAIPLAYGATATIEGSVTANAAPEEGRQLFGELLVVTDEGAVVGRGQVRIGSVTTG